MDLTRALPVTLFNVNKNASKYVKLGSSVRSGELICSHAMREIVTNGIH